MTRWSTRLPDLQPKSMLVHALARALVRAERSEGALVAQAAELLGREWRWLHPVARRYLERFAQTGPPRQRAVEQFLCGDPSFQRALEKRDLRIVRLVQNAPSTQPDGVASTWNLPSISSVGALAEWLRLTSPELEWFADLKGLLARGAAPRLRHYSYRAIEKTSGGLRLIEAPKQHLRAIQRQILREILDNIPVHSAAHGFVKARSIRTFAASHVGRAAVLRMDLADFFPSLSRGRIQTLFRMAGYPEAVADQLGGLCTTPAPRAIWKELGIDPQQAVSMRRLYEQAHLPQGAPTSPALSNICAYRLDCRLHGLARSAGAVYTRYADDLAFSGDDDFAQGAGRFSVIAAAIVLDEGFNVQFRKTRVMRQGVRQHLAGLVTNRRLNVPRGDYEQLKAILTNCLRHGPDSQNRNGRADFRAHLHGRISFVESVNESKGARLRSRFEQIEWN